MDAAVASDTPTTFRPLIAEESHPMTADSHTEVRGLPVVGPPFGHKKNTFMSGEKKAA